MAIRDEAQRGFQTGAVAYERGRPSYPRQAIDWLVGQLSLATGRTVVDVGAGTGKLTRELVASGAEVVAVEPVPAMRERGSISRFTGRSARSSSPIVASRPVISATNGAGPSPRAGCLSGLPKSRCRPSRSSTSRA